MFGQCLVDLVGVLLSLMRYPEDIDQLPEDEVDDLKRHRYDVADALRDVMRIIGGVSCLRQVLSILKQEVSFTDYVAQIGLVLYGRRGLYLIVACLCRMHIHHASFARGRKGRGTAKSTLKINVFLFVFVLMTSRMQSFELFIVYMCDSIMCSFEDGRGVE